MKIFIYFLLFILSIGSPACTVKRYIDKPTPAGAVPPPPAIAEPEIKPVPRDSGFNGREGSTVSLGTSGERFELGDNISRNRPGFESEANAFQGIFGRFSAAYKLKDQPRIAIFLNRSLSDEVREWHVDQRTVVSGNGSITSTRETKHTFREDTMTGPLSVSEQRKIDIGGNRINPQEQILWPFEDGFMQPFLRAGAKLIDRATIMRLSALKEAEQKNAGYDPVSAKKVEMSSLVDKADIFIEVLISRTPFAPGGYEFKASAKEVKTGRIIANATSLNWDKERLEKKKIIATSSGYKISKETELPEMKDLSRDLAIDLMNSITNTWELGY